MNVRFTIPGEPKGKARPRVFMNKEGRSQAITPKETLSYENLVKWVYQNTQDATKLEGEIEARIVAMYPIPKSMTKKNRQLIDEGKLHPTKKPDLDNVAKIVLDSLNGIAYSDDSQIVKLTVEKYYSVNPRVEVMLYEVEQKK
ncbi:RusA family crossover junction endodeoxyribonuclease [Niameybacter massiliensis]|uniref:RusA family crossover junction endodeoxyribonuclease n=1 Tax=Holtiella tumoricola TaxID=3018743 RepID=A0AA42J0U2_9FIRM|nr:RusA family crossover junction endodeoxyribonuclease [Holtiella tumoricola]MDA3731553.1 RusA family crossover junction endodeoxyribonuclease [Holtiella tumoricola]